jgi:hypothetical protein
MWADPLLALSNVSANQTYCSFLSIIPIVQSMILNVIIRRHLRMIEFECALEQRNDLEESGKRDRNGEEMERRERESE